MLLSIVECSNYRNYEKEKSSVIGVKNLSSEIEVIGPVPGKNVAIMRNKGASKARGQWVLFKDADCEISHEAILSTVKRLSSSKSSVHALGGIYKSESQHFWSQVYHRIQRRWVIKGLNHKKIHGFHEGIHLLGGVLLVNREAFQLSGGFREDIGWGGEETEWVQRFTSQGFRSGVSFRLWAQHDNQLSFLGFLKRAWFQNFNGGYYCFKKTSTTQADQKYFKAPLLFVIPVLLFFITASTASFSGQTLRRLGV